MIISMITERITLGAPPELQAVERAAEILHRGGLVAIPTETVYGLAANALDSSAVGRIFEAKGRPQDNPLIVHIDSMAMLDKVVSSISDEAVALAEQFWPGPLTMVLPRRSDIPSVVSAGLDTVAVRMPSHLAAAAIIHACGLPLAAPSANLSGSPSPTTAAHVLADLDGRIEAVADGGACTVGVESTVISLVSCRPRLLRPGGITPEQLSDVLGEIEIDPAVTGQMVSTVASSPGMKYKHYSPKANVVMVQGALPQFCEFLTSLPNQEGVFALCFAGEEKVVPLPCVTYGCADDPLTQSQRLFSALRELDEQGANTVYARCPQPSGVGLAVFNRLQRAAAFQMIAL